MEAKKAAIEDWFRAGAGVCKQQIEKVSLEPDSKYMFLDINRMVDMGERLKFLGDKLVPLDHFLESLFTGEYHVDTIEELSSLLEKTKNQRDRLEVKMRLDLGSIEDDMNNLCRKIVTRVEDYFAELTSRLKQIHIDNNIDAGIKLEKFERLLEKKIDNKAAFGAGTDSFDLKTFYSKFKIMQKEPEKLERFFQGMIRRKHRYDTFREDKDLQQFQHLFREESSFEENMITYLENKHKLQRIEDSLPVYAASDADSAEERFVDNLIGLIDKSIGNVRHFDIRSTEQDEEEQRPPLSESKKPQQIGTLKPFEKNLMTPLSKVQRSLSKDRQTSVKSKPISNEQTPTKSLKSPSFRDSSRLEKTTGSKETQDSMIYLQGARELREGLNKEANLEALAAGFELSGTDWTKNSFDDAIAFLEELQQVEELVITLAEIPSIGKGRMKLLSEVIASKKNLKNLDLCFAKSKLNKQDLEEVQNCLHGLQRLQFFSLNIDGYSLINQRVSSRRRVRRVLQTVRAAASRSHQHQVQLCAQRVFASTHHHSLQKLARSRSAEVRSLSRRLRTPERRLAVPLRLAAVRHLRRGQARPGLLCVGCR